MHTLSCVQCVCVKANTVGWNQLGPQYCDSPSTKRVLPICVYMASVNLIGHHGRAHVRGTFQIASFHVTACVSLSALRSFQMGLN